jgi:hypothetical protein
MSRRSGSFRLDRIEVRHGVAPSGICRLSVGIARLLTNRSRHLIWIECKEFTIQRRPCYLSGNDVIAFHSSAIILRLPSQIGTSLSSSLSVRRLPHAVACSRRRSSKSSLGWFHGHSISTVHLTNSASSGYLSIEIRILGVRLSPSRFADTSTLTFSSGSNSK